MTATVDTKPSLITPGNVASNIAVRAQTWGDTAQVLNMARGYGSVLVAPHFVGETVPAQTTYVYRYRATPTLTDSVMVWVVNCFATNPTVQFAPTYSTAVQIGVPGTFGQPPVYILDSVVAQPLIDTEFTLSVTTGNAAFSACTIHSIALIEMPRTALATAEGGIDINTLRIGDPIYDTTGASYSAIGASVGTVMNVARRVSQAAWFRVNPFTVTGTGFVNQSSVHRPALTRRTISSLATRTVTVRVFADALVSPGEVQITGVKALSFATFTIPVAAASWSAFQQISIDTEEGGTVNGLRGGTFDTIQVTARTTLGGGTVRLYGFSIWESENDVP